MFVFSNLATSLDGKIATQKRNFFPLGTQEDLRQMQVLRQRCDAVLMGAATFRAYKKPCLASGRNHPPVNVVLSSTLEGIYPTWEFFRQKKLSRIFFVGHRTSSKRIQMFARSSEIIVLKKSSSKNPTAIQVLNALEKKGINRLLIEGGGGVMWDFASRNLIDEYHVTLTPKILGGRDAPTLVDGKGFSPKQILNLKLRQCRIVQDELYLIYQKRS